MGNGYTEISTFTRKQAGVVFAAMKRGNITMSEQAVSEMYGMAAEWKGEGLAVFSNIEAIAPAIAHIREAVEAIFSDDYDTAQKHIDQFEKFAARKAA